MIRGVDLNADFLDFKGPQDTYPDLDAKYGFITDPTIRIDLDPPNVSKELCRNPTPAGMTAFLKKRAGDTPPNLYGYRYRNSSSAHLHVEVDLAGTYKPSELLRIRQLLGDDDYRVLCDSRRALKNPIYLGGYLHDAKWIPGDKPEGGRGSVIGKAGKWTEVMA